MKNRSKKQQERAEIWDKRLRQTNSYKKLWRYVNSLVAEASFQRKVSSLRKKYKLPPQGVTDDETDIFDTYFEDVNVWMDFVSEVNQWAENEYTLPRNWIRETLRDYIIYNELFEPQSGPLTALKLVDLHLLLKKKDSSANEIVDRLLKIAEEYPCALFIGPNADQTEITNYVSKAYYFAIKPIQKRHFKSGKKKPGDTRSRSDKKKERNEFIYEHSHLRPEVVMGLVNDKYNQDLKLGTIQKLMREMQNKYK